jgi:L,D-peptidoglycan transpeptidase YkuD (ErfK/YbiS/YcfS/YnhG family)
MYETPFYNYAVVIDYNRSPVVQGAGSAFFLHVTDGNPTAGCVSIPQANLVSIMGWLAPSTHPRILIGVAS